MPDRGLFKCQIGKGAVVALALVFFWPGFANANTEVPIIAVASNFSHPVREIARAYKDSTGVEVELVMGATGTLYAQIQNGAPFAVFLAADEKRPRLLDESGQIIVGTRSSYAQGRLALWSPDLEWIIEGPEILEAADFNHLAVANARLAPYGRAAEETLKKLGIWDRVQSRLVRGQNIGQTFSFVKSGSAPLGLVSVSQIMALPPDERGTWWLVPADFHSPIDQQAVLLQDTPEARGFLEFLHSLPARDIIQRYGYGFSSSTEHQDESP